MKNLIENATRAEVVRTERLSSGASGEVAAVELSDGRSLVAKVQREPAENGGNLDLEGWMLRYLAERSELPVPRVHVAEPGLLVMDRVPGSTGARGEAELDAAEHVARLHLITGERFGLERDTLIGGLPQSNAESGSWIEFFRDQRLTNMARQCVDAGRAPEGLLERVQRLGERLPRLIDEPRAPALLHGDLWGGNILSDGDRVTGFIDPAIYYGHPEIELAFTALFSTFTQAFYDRYHEIHPIRNGFFEERADLYNLYPLLVHTRLFGGSYLSQAERTLARYGV
jgi:fructosamine-3-kinase